MPLSDGKFLSLLAERINSIHCVIKHGLITMPDLMGYFE
ncbi:hypothetical protein BN128_4257 [Cronobacter sakazakii 696]|nr:hypothetical protein BN129_4329 [Cronobacter sakazakii 701]CCK05943.1 hypothetical protein BN128_4257 [Cronobacter sakazakii 696]